MKESGNGHNLRVTAGKLPWTLALINPFSSRYINYQQYCEHLSCLAFLLSLYCSTAVSLLAGVLPDRLRSRADRQDNLCPAAPFSFALAAVCRKEWVSSSSMRNKTTMIGLQVDELSHNRFLLLIFSPSCVLSKMKTSRSVLLRSNSILFCTRFFP